MSDSQSKKPLTLVQQVELRQLHIWISKLEWAGTLPDNPVDARKLLRELQSGRPPTESQLKFLTHLGHQGPVPSDMNEASDLISTLKNRGYYVRSGPSPYDMERNKDKPATDSQLDLIQDICKELHLVIGVSGLTRGEASSIIEEHLERYKQSKAERAEKEAKEREAAKLKKAEEKIIEKIAKLRERLLGQVAKLREKNKGKRISEDPFEAVVITSRSGCPQSGKPNEFILIDDAADNLPPFKDCPKDCKMDCRFEGVRTSTL